MTGDAHLLRQTISACSLDGDVCGGDGRVLEKRKAVSEEMSPRKGGSNPAIPLSTD
jgi:hypothetical protein